MNHYRTVLTSGPDVTVKLSCLLNSRHTTLYLSPSIRLGSGAQLSRAKAALICGAAMLEIQPIEGSGLGHRVWPHYNHQK